MSTPSKILAAILTIVVVVALSVAAYQLGWWLQEDSVNRTTAIDQNSLSVQETARTVVSDVAAQVAEIEAEVLENPANAAALRAQAEAVATRGCDRVEVIRGPVSSNIADFAFTYCNVTLEVQ